VGFLHIHKLADRSGGQAALDGDLPGAPPGRWPLAGVVLEPPIPKEAQLSTTMVDRGIAEGWIVGEGHEVVTRPAGTAENPWGPTPTAPTPHVFHHYKHLTIAGHRFKVVHQPDKYAAEGGDGKKVTAEIYASGATRVDWFYGLELEG
jgi:hypothetical protein